MYLSYYYYNLFQIWRADVGDSAENIQYFQFQVSGVKAQIGSILSARIILEGAECLGNLELHCGPTGVNSGEF